MKKYTAKRLLLRKFLRFGGVLRFSGVTGFTITELGLVFAIVVTTSVLMQPVIRYSRVNTEKIMCTNNIQEIGLALYIYAREHGGTFPKSLKDLYDEKYLADKKIMNCPSCKTIGTPEAPNYEYTSGLSIKDESMLALVQDKVTNHPYKGKNVLYVNGLVKWTE